MFRVVVHMYRLFCHCLFLLCPPFGASGRLCFVNVTCPDYLKFKPPDSFAGMFQTFCCLAIH